MRKSLLIIIALSIIYMHTTSGQQLDSIQIVVPCFGTYGMTLPASANPVDSATQYCWTTESGSINGLLINGQVTPVCTPIPSTQIIFTLPQAYYILCVTATSPCCTSNTSCDTIWGYAPFEFDSLNSTIANPNSTIPYGVFFGCPPGNNNILYWSVTGDVGLNSTGNTSITTGTSNPFVNLNFGPSFTTGTLCVYLVTNFGMASPTICMTINAPTGISEYDSNPFNLFVDHENQQIKINCDAFIPGNYKVSMFDASGKIIIQEKINVTPTKNNFILKTAGLRKGIYFMSIQGTSKTYTAKVSIVN